MDQTFIVKSLIASLDRGEAIGKAFGTVTNGIPLITSIRMPALADASTETSVMNTLRDVDRYDCLLDLPPIPPNKVRIFLCRHGQTENNRLRLVQGARVDPPINPTGTLMAQSDGEAFSTLRRKQKLYPMKIAHSTLLRAKQSAEAMSAVINNNYPGTHQVQTFTLPTIGEVDFGPIAEGKPISEVKAQMYKVYAAWSIGQIDTAPKLGGESGRIVVSRVCDALFQLTSLAKDNGGSIAAVSHSTFLRTLLAVALDISLLEASTLGQVNGCINILDVDLSKPSNVLGPRSNVFGGKLSFAPKDAIFSVPSVQVVRINETRHLKGII